MRIKPFRGSKLVTKNKANQVNNSFLSAQKPDRTEMRREAHEFIEIVKHRRSQSGL